MARRNDSNLVQYTAGVRPGGMRRMSWGAYRRTLRCPARRQNGWQKAVFYIQPGRGLQALEAVAVRLGWGFPSKKTTGPATVARNSTTPRPTFFFSSCCTASFSAVLVHKRTCSQGSGRKSVAREKTMDRCRLLQPRFSVDRELDSVVFTLNPAQAFLAKSAALAAALLQRRASRWR